ncbi:hypothetical protein V1478_000195 [Vespula squamosa]|uniref:Uncharacterized protein n=1 Tax=Vespula squamosa TaxID=30214 RepID=A0ABD2C5N7_VESSQ
MSYLALDSNAWQRAELAMEMTFDIVDDRRPFRERLPANTPQRGCSHYRGKLVTVNPRSSVPHARCEGTSLRDYACVTLKKRRRKLRDKARVSRNISNVLSILWHRLYPLSRTKIGFLEENDKKRNTKAISPRTVRSITSSQCVAKRIGKTFLRQWNKLTVSLMEGPLVVGETTFSWMIQKKVKMGQVIDGTRSTQYAIVSRIYSPPFSVVFGPGNHIGMAGNVRGRARQRIAETSLGRLLLDYALYRVL